MSFCKLNFVNVSLSLWLVFLLNGLSASVSAAENPEVTKEGNSKFLLGMKVKIQTPDDYLLSADYYAGLTRGGGVLVLHDCSHDSKNYINLGEKLSENGLHTLVLDFRGYGGSASDLYSQAKIKAEAKNIVAYQDAFAALTSYWESDVIIAYNFLLGKINKKSGIAVISVGCSSLYAVELAEKMHVNSFVMVTPQMNYNDKERYKNLFDIPSYFISSSHHTQTLHTAEELFAWNGAKRSKIQIFKGDSQGFGLLRKNQYLLTDMTLWLKKNLERKGK